MRHKLTVVKIQELVEYSYHRDATIEDVVFATAVNKDAWTAAIDEVIELLKEMRDWRAVDAVRHYKNTELEK